MPDITQRRDGTSLDAFLTNPNLPGDLRDRVARLDDWRKSTSNDVEGSHAVIEAGRQDEEIANTNLATAERQATQPGSTVTDAQLRVLRDHAERAKKRTEAERTKHRKNIASNVASEEVHRSVHRLLEGARTYEPASARKSDRVSEIAEPGGKLTGLALRLHPVKLKGDPHEVKLSKRAEITSLKADLAERDSAPARADTVKRLLRADIDSAARRGALHVDTGGEGTPSIRWPTVAIPAAPLRSEGPNVVRVIDAEALICRLYGDRIIEEVEAAVDAAYQQVEVALDPHEKARETKRLKAAILEAERLECAAIWQLHEQGEPLDFRADTDPRAVLGVA